MMTSVYTKDSIIELTMEFEVSKRHILRPTLSANMVQRVWLWERQKRHAWKKEKGKGPREMNDLIIIFDKMFFEEEKMETRENKKKVKLDFFFQNCPFWHII